MIELQKWLALLAQSASWAAAFLFVRVLEGHIEPLTMTAWRSIFSVLAVGLGCLFLGGFKTPSWKSWKAQGVMLISGLTMAWLWSAMAFGEQELSSSMAAVLSTIAVLTAYILSVVWIKARSFAWVNVAGLAVAGIGIVFATGAKLVDINQTMLVDMAFLGSGFVGLSFGSALLRKFVHHIPPLTAVFFSLIYCTLVLVVAAFVWEAPLKVHYTAQIWEGTAFLGIVSTGIGYYLFFWLTQRAGPLFASYFGFLVPSLGVLMGVFFLNESFRFNQLLGMGLVFIGLLLSYFRRRGPVVKKV